MHGTHTHTVGTDNFSFHLMILLLLDVFVVVQYSLYCVLMYLYIVVFNAISSGAQKHILLQKQFLVEG